MSIIWEEEQDSQEEDIIWGEEATTTKKKVTESDIQKQLKDSEALEKMSEAYSNYEEFGIIDPGIGQIVGPDGDIIGDIPTNKEYTPPEAGRQIDPAVEYTEFDLDTAQTTPAVNKFWERAPTTRAERKKAYQEVVGKELMETPPEIEEDYEEPDTFWGQFKEGITRGYKRSIEAGVGYGAELLGRTVLGDANMINWGQQQGDETMKELLKRPELKPPKDLEPFFKGGLLEGGKADPRWYGRTLGETLPYMGSVVGGSLVGGLAGGTAGAVTLGGGTSYTLASGNYYSELLHEGEDPEKADHLANAYGALVAITENMMGVKPYSLGTNVNQGAMRVAADSWKNFFKNEIKHVSLQTLKQMGGEGGEEVIQEVGGNILRKWTEREVPVIAKDLGNQFAAGAVMALPFGATNIRVPKIEGEGISTEAADTKRQQLQEAARIFDEQEGIKRAGVDFGIQKKKLYHGTSEEFDVIRSMEELRAAGAEVEPSNIAGKSSFVHLTADKDLAQQYANKRAENMRGEPRILDFTVDKSILDLTRQPAEYSAQEKEVLANIAEDMGERTNNFKQGKDGFIGGEIKFLSEKDVFDQRRVDFSFTDIEQSKYLTDVLKQHGYAGIKFVDKGIGPGLEETFALIPEVARGEDIWAPEIADMPADDYKQTLEKEIGEMEELPTIKRGSWQWKPPTRNYQNPYTKTMYKILDKAGNVWDQKGPAVFKTGATREIANLMKERQRVYDGLVQRYREDTIAPVEELSTADKKKVGKMIFKTIPVPENYQPFIKDIDAEIGQLGQKLFKEDKQMVEDGKLKEEYALLNEETWRENLGEYARTLYIREDETAEGGYTMTPRSAIGPDGVINRSAFKRKMTDAEWGANALKYQGKTEEEIETYTLEELEEMGREAKEQWGWTTQADYVLARTFKDLSSAYANRQFQKAIVEDPELYSNEPKEGLEAVENFLPKGKTEDVRLGPINNGYIHPGLEQEIETLIQGRDDGLAIFGEPLSWWKAIKVAGNPPTVIRNFISAMIAQSDMAGYPVWLRGNASRYGEIVKDYLNRGEMYEKWRNKGLFGSDYFSVEIGEDELSRVIERTEKANNPMKTFAQGLSKEAFQKQREARQKLFNWYGEIDHLNRMYLAESAVRDEANLSEATHFANKWQLDYRYVPKIIEKARTGLGGYLAPFISFYGLMAPRIAETTITRPWTMLKYPIALASMNHVARGMLGVDREEIEAAKPDFLKEQPYVATLPWRDDNGNLQFLNMSYNLPFGGPKSTFMDWDAATNMLKTGGLYGIIQSTITGRDNFTGRRIYDKHDPKSVKRKKVGKYLMRSLGPGIVDRGLKIWDAAQGEITGEPIQEQRSVAQEVARALAVSVYSGGFNTAYWKMYELRSGMREIESSMEDIMADPNLSTEEKREKIRQYRTELIRRRQKLQELGRNFPTAPQPEQQKEGGGEEIIWE